MSKLICVAHEGGKGLRAVNPYEKERGRFKITNLSWLDFEQSVTVYPSLISDLEIGGTIEESETEKVDQVYNVMCEWETIGKKALKGYLEANSTQNHPHYLLRQAIRRKEPVSEPDNNSLPSGDWETPLTEAEVKHGMSKRLQMRAKNCPVKQPQELTEEEKIEFSHELSYLYSLKFERGVDIDGLTEFLNGYLIYKKP